MNDSLESLFLSVDCKESIGDWLRRKWFTWADSVARKVFGTWMCDYLRKFWLYCLDMLQVERPSFTVSATLEEFISPRLCKKLNRWLFSSMQGRQWVNAPSAIQTTVIVMDCRKKKHLLRQTERKIVHSCSRVLCWQLFQPVISPQ